MLVSNYKVFITKNGDGAISYTMEGFNYKLTISKNNELLMQIFRNHYNKLKTFKNRHYAIAKWIVRDIRAKGYYFKAYAGNYRNIRPIKNTDAIKLSSKELYEQQIMENMNRRNFDAEVSDLERLVH